MSAARMDMTMELNSLALLPNSLTPLHAEIGRQNRLKICRALLVSVRVRLQGPSP